ncbi:hypothetical protein RND81_10G063800 [Saponaria officinalis]|uniref:Protein kinase domain-containing protein n=1 Tax=Saponaria officinalis TaxID=3572 RepID=A0AAW1I191_SAPOF
MKSTSLMLIFLLSVSLLPTAFPAVAPPGVTSALTVLKSTLRGRWNTTGDNACTWQGVVCNPAGDVIELHLPGVGFMGPIPSNVFPNLTSLNFLSLRFNSITGPLPNDLSSLTQLKFLYLQHNRISGNISDVLFKFPKLLRLDLSGNRLSGGIPIGFNNLTTLVALFMQNNQLTGAIPDLKLDNLKEFNVSYNLLTGTVPEQLCSAFPSSAFAGNSLTVCPYKPSSSGGSGDNNGGSRKKLSAGAIAGIIIGCVLLLLALLLLLFFCCCRKNKKDDQPAATRSVEAAAAVPATAAAAETAKTSDVETGRASNGQSSATVPVVAKSKAGGSGIDKTLVFFGNAPRTFDLDDLLKASAEVLGKGIYGTTYKAALENGVAVAVKRLRDVTATDKEFKDKMEEIGRMEHENLVALRAYHCSPNEKLLVFDYLPMGSLSALLHGNKGSGRTPLNWETRSTIALGAARGISYIHSQNPTSSHGNIKSSNVLLSNSYEARVSDFGLSQLANPGVSANRVAGYRAPEVTDPRRVSQKADVYSFGVFLLELLTGKAPTHALLNEEGVDLPRWVQSVVREEWAAEVFDLELLRYQNVEEDMVQLLQLAIDCCAQYPDSRPSITEVTSRIEQICRSSTRAGQDPLSEIASDADNSPRPS